MSVFDKKSSAGLREKYNHAIQTAKSLHMQGGAEERDGKLYFNGTVNSVDEKNQIWNALKTVGDWEKEVVADIKVKAATAQPAPPTGSQGATPSPTISYTVQSGDSWAEIALRLNMPLRLLQTVNPQVVRPYFLLKPGDQIFVPNAQQLASILQ